MKFIDNIPIYIQIKDHLLGKIFRGEICAGERLPSIRESAQLYEVNPNTVVRVYEDLENEDIIYTERTNGKFLTADKGKIESMKKAYLSEKFATFMSDMEKLGANLSEIENLLKERE